MHQSIMHGTGEKDHFLLYIFLNHFQGVSLVLEYAWFLSKQNNNADHSLALATKAYQTSGSQAAVLNALQPFIEVHCDNPDILINVIISIIHNHRMCKWVLIQAKV